MHVWTISAQLGTGGEAVAAELAARTGVRLLDRGTLAEFAHRLDDRIDDIDRLEERIGGRLSVVALGLAMTTGAAEACRELQFRNALPEIGRRILSDVTKQSAVVLSHAAFAVLRDHPCAIHVRLHAPFDWRVDEVQRRDLVSHERAVKLVRHDDHVHHAVVRELYHADLDDLGAFSLALDASRLSRERMVDLLAAAAKSD